MIYTHIYIDIYTCVYICKKNYMFGSSGNNFKWYVSAVYKWSTKYVCAKCSLYWQYISIQVFSSFIWIGYSQNHQHTHLYLVIITLVFGVQIRTLLCYIPINRFEYFVALCSISQQYSQAIFIVDWTDLGPGTFVNTCMFGITFYLVSHTSATCSNPCNY